MALQYTTEALVQSELDGIKITADAVKSKITTDELTEFITQEENTLNAAIGAKYQVPIVVGVSPIAHSIMRTIATYLSAYRVLKIVDPEKAEGNVLSEDGKTTVKRVNLRQLAEKMIEKIKTGALFLEDADQVSDQVASFQTKNVVETNQFSTARTDLW